MQRRPGRPRNKIAGWNGRHLRQALGRAGATIADLARATDVDRTTARRYITDEIAPPLPWRAIAASWASHVLRWPLSQQDAGLAGWEPAEFNRVVRAHARASKERWNEWPRTSSRLP